MRINSQIYPRLTNFWLLNLPLFILCFLSFINYSSGFEFASQAYFILLSITQAAWFSWVLLVLVPYLIYWLSFKKLSPYPLAGFLSFAALLILVLDQIIYSQFHLHLQWVFLQMLLSPARSHIFSFTTHDKITLAALCGALAILLIICWLLVRRLTINKKLIYSLQFIFFLAGLLSQGLYVLADASYEPKLLISTQLVPGFYGITAKRFLASHHLIEPKARPFNLLAISNSSLRYPLHPLTLAPLSKKTNILILAIDSWRADSMNAELTPEIAKIADKSTSYEKHFSGGNSTRAGIFSLFYSISPQLFDTAYCEALGPLLFDVLAKRQYEIYAFTSASALSPPFNRTVFLSVPNFVPTLAGADSVERDKLVSKNLITSIDEALEKNKAFFAFGFYDSAHAYLYPSPPFKAKFQPAARVSRSSLALPDQAKLWRNQYANSLYFIDGLIGEVVEHLRAKNALDDTLIIITGDHGEEFDDNHQGFWGHNSNFTPIQTQVPLVVHWPNQTQSARKSFATSHYDLIPSIFKALGVTNPTSDYSLGKELSDESERDPILMGSYSSLAALSLQKNRMAVSNHLGYFQMQTLQGLPTKEPLDSDLITKAYLKMQQFSRR